MSYRLILDKGPDIKGYIEFEYERITIDDGVHVVDYNITKEDAQQIINYLDFVFDL